MLDSPAVYLVALPSVPTVAGTDQASGPRPTRDPDAVPDGKIVEGDKPTLDLTVSVVSNYLFRGVTQSAGHGAVQASAEVASPAGFYAGAWGSSIAAYESSHAEVDLYGGYRQALSGFNVDIGVISYFYPGADGVSSAELYASAAREIGGTTIKLGTSYTPHQSALGKGDGLYLFAEAEQPLPWLPVTLRGHIGRETGVSTVTGAPKIDWLLGSDVHVGPATISLAWADARYQGRKLEQHRDGGIVAGVAFDL